ncbi:helix-turn-helix domain-containing protein [Nocardia sp. NPDC002869]|uniref:helix-turn-helix domain-containing protein n=1 Tax=Nocardia sp. NPDC002869 TaxID=3161032 RepID=UPI00398D0B34
MRGRPGRGRPPRGGPPPAAGISPETLRKIETGRLPSPGFGTVVSLSRVLELPLEELAEIWTADNLAESA